MGAAGFRLGGAQGSGGLSWQSFWGRDLSWGEGGEAARTRSGKNKADGAAPPPPGAGLSAGKNYQRGGLHRRVCV